MALHSDLICYVLWWCELVCFGFLFICLLVWFFLSWACSKTFNHWHSKNPPRAHWGIASTSSPVPGTSLSSCKMPRVFFNCCTPSVLSLVKNSGASVYLSVWISSFFISTIPTIESKLNAAATAVSVLVPALLSPSAYVPKKRFSGMFCEMNGT